MSRFHDQLAAGLGRLRTHAGETVTYARGAQSVEVTAVVGESAHDSIDDGMPVTVQSRDFMIAVEDLLLGASAVTPQAGDRITQGSALFVVRDISGSNCWRYSDHPRSTYRIHTVEVDA